MKSRVNAMNAPRKKKQIMVMSVQRLDLFKHLVVKRQDRDPNHAKTLYFVKPESSGGLSLHPL